MGPNNEDSKYLDVYMEGTAAGWIAVGFSENQIMVRCLSIYNSIVYNDIYYSACIILNN